jgi:hypothetical protein
VLRTDANVLGFNMTSVIVIMSIGTLILTSALYAKIGRSDNSEHHDASDVQHPNPRVNA